MAATPAEAPREAKEQARARQSAPAPQPAPAQELDRIAENRQSATREAPLNLQKRRESGQAAAEPSERKLATPPAPSAAPANVAPAAPAPAVPSLPKTQSADAVPATEAPVLAGSALKRAQGESNAALERVRGNKRLLPPAPRMHASMPETRGARAPLALDSNARHRAESAAIESATACSSDHPAETEGRHSEADVELKLFRERYPQVQPPPEALTPRPAQ